jgi:hypothetical protein
MECLPWNGQQRTAVPFGAVNWKTTQDGAIRRVVAEDKYRLWQEGRLSVRENQAPANQN